MFPKVKACGQVTAQGARPCCAGHVVLFLSPDVQSTQVSLNLDRFLPSTLLLRSGERWQGVLRFCRREIGPSVNELVFEV